MKNYEDMTTQEQEEYMKAMTIADKAWYEWKTNGKPKTTKRTCLEYKQNHRVI